MKIASTSCNTLTFSAVISPKIRIPNPGPGKGCLPNKSASIPIWAPTLRTSSLNIILSGSTTFNFMKSGKPPTLWCDLIVAEGPPVAETLSITSG